MHRCVAAEGLRLCALGWRVLGAFLVWGEEDARRKAWTHHSSDFHIYSAHFEFGGDASRRRVNLEGARGPESWKREWAHELSLRTSLDGEDVPTQSPCKLWELWLSFRKRR